jgi:3-oxoacyl-[acyl-carrier protein] reductase
MELSGKIALVTGGGTGLGKEISLQLARAGVDVAINYTKSVADAEATAAEVRALGRRAMTVRGDVSKDADVKAMVDGVVNALGGIDLLVNNAGYTIFADFKKLDDVSGDEWDRVMAVNVKGAFLVSRAVAPAMRSRGAGAIVNITSTAGVRAGGSSIPYSVSKAAENMLTRCLAISLAPEITVNAVAPGLMDTRWGRLWGDQLFVDAPKANPLEKLATLDEIAESVIFFLKNRSTTGQTFVLDGGKTMD